MNLILGLPIACHVGFDIAFQKKYFVREIYIEIVEHAIHRRSVEFKWKYVTYKTSWSMVITRMLNAFIHVEFRMKVLRDISDLKNYSNYEFFGCL
jgi:hypothetical protein